jgi:hypothetical protein
MTTSKAAGRESTPPNQASTVTRQSTGIRTPLKRPGFIQTHTDSRSGNRLRKPCTGCAKSIAQGANLPQSAKEKHSVKVKTTTSSGTLTAYVQKGRFDVKSMNKILVFWIVQQSLPWACFDDYLLGFVIDYCNPNARIYSQTWAVIQAHKLYVTIQ